jgi:hypothetical protein
MENPETLATHPLPLDPEIARGVAIWGDGTSGWGDVTAEHLDSLVARTQESFAKLKDDESRKYGGCLAFAIDMGAVDEYAVDVALIAAATKENGGTRTLRARTDEIAIEKLRDIWSGEDDKSQMHLAKFVGYVVMEDNTIQEGIVYTLCAKNKQAKESEDE